MLSLGLVQMTSTADRQENWSQVEFWVREATGKGAQLVALPEGFSYLGDDAGKLAGAEPLMGPFWRRLGRLARACGIWLLAGGAPETCASPDHVYMTAALYDNDGEIRAVYRKIHLFDIQIPSGPIFRESATVIPGDRTVVAETPWGKVGLSICYDLRFPELYRRLVGEGAQLLLVPSAFTLHTGKDHWRPLLQARAIENVAYVAAPAQFGFHGENRHSYGRSLIVNPWGQVVAESSDRPGTVVAELDFEFLRSLRRQLPCLEHMRMK